MSRHRGDDPQTRPQPAIPTPPVRRARFDAGSVMQALSLVVALALAVFLIGYVADQRAALDCQAQINRDFREALNVRADRAATERAAVRQLLIETVGTPTSVAEDRAARDRYIDEAERLAADTPPLPNLERHC